MFDGNNLLRSASPCRLLGLDRRTDITDQIVQRFLQQLQFLPSNVSVLKITNSRFWHLRGKSSLHAIELGSGNLQAGRCSREKVLPQHREWKHLQRCSPAPKRKFCIRHICQKTSGGSIDGQAFR